MKAGERCRLGSRRYSRLGSLRYASFFGEGFERSCVLAEKLEDVGVVPGLVALGWLRRRGPQMVESGHPALRYSLDQKLTPKPLRDRVFAVSCKSLSRRGLRLLFRESG